MTLWWLWPYDVVVVVALRRCGGCGPVTLWWLWPCDIVVVVAL